MGKDATSFQKKLLFRKSKQEYYDRLVAVQLKRDAQNRETQGSIRVPLETMRRRTTDLMSRKRSQVRQFKDENRRLAEIRAKERAEEVAVLDRRKLAARQQHENVRRPQWQTISSICFSQVVLRTLILDCCSHPTR